MAVARRFVLLFFLLAFKAAPCIALSSNTADSLKRALEAAPVDTTRAAILLELAALYQQDSLIRSFEFAHRARRIAAEHGWPELQVRAEIAIGACYDIVQQWENAIRSYRAARARALHHRLDAQVLRSEVLLSEAFNSAGSLDSTLHYKLMAMEHARLRQDSLAEAQLLIYLGGYFKDLHRSREALAYWHAALAATRRLHRPDAQAMALNNLADTYLDLRMTDSAGSRLREALGLVRGRAGSRSEAYILASLGTYHMQARRPQEAIRSTRDAITLALQPDGDRQLAELAMEQLSTIYSTSGDPAQALACFKRYVDLRDSNRNESRKAADARAVVKYNFDLQAASNESERQNLRATSRLRLNALIAAGTGLMIITVLAGYAYFALLQNRRKAATIASQAALLREQNEAIQESLREKEMLIKEVHHRVKNNLQVISSLLQLQGARSTDPLVRRSLEESQNRVLSIAFIHHNLYMHEDMQQVEMQSFLAELVQHLGSVYNGPDREIAVEQDVEPLSLDMDVAMPLGLIVNELLTNSFKYAFPGRAQATIRISLHNCELAQCELVYTDDGVGMKDHPAGLAGKTLGLTLVADLCRQLGGRPELNGGNGFHFRLRFSCTPDDDNEQP